MADTNEKVMELVAAELKKNPEATTDELQDAAKKKFPSVAKLSKRQFNARYPLQIKRKRPAARRKAARKRASGADRRKTERRGSTGRTVATGGRKESATTDADRDAIRRQFLLFATDITAAEGRNDLVKVLANVDTYVAAVVKAAG